MEKKRIYRANLNGRAMKIESGSPVGCWNRLEKELKKTRMELKGAGFRVRAVYVPKTTADLIADYRKKFPMPDNIEAELEQMRKTRESFPKASIWTRIGWFFGLR